MRRTQKIGLGVLVVVLLLIGARLAAPHFVLQYVNKTLDGLDGYGGHVDDVDLHIWRGAYAIEGVRIEKTGGDEPIPLVSVDRVDISVEWPALLDGSIVGELDLYRPELNLLAEKRAESKAEDQREKREAKKAARGDSSWQTQVKELVPLKINRIGVHDGSVHYRDLHVKPKVDVYVQKLNGRVTNLTNSEEIAESLAANASFEGIAMGSGKLKIDGRIDPYQELPTFRMEAQLEDLEVTELNDFLRAYARADAERGRISVYTEANAAKGRFEGYVKPLIHDLRVLDWKKEEEGVMRKLWEGIVELGTELFENHEKEQVATRIPFSGKVEQPDADVATTVLYVLRNAFVRALSAGLDQSLGKDGATAKRGDD
jgi:hypothetical protein